MTRTFEEASREIQASLQRHLGNVQSYDEELDSSEDSSDEVVLGDSDELIEKVFGSYDVGNYSQAGGIDIRTKEALVQSIGSSGSCLICISDLKKKDPVWSCQECHCILHMQCIQRWATDSIYQQKRDLESQPDLRSSSSSRIHKQSLEVYQWGCPKCRTTFPESQIPNRYTCYCGKLADPPFDPWIVPHSCGEVCEKSLKPDCGHQCLLLCHPGPCPPCPQVVKSKCFCGQTAPSTKRCFNKNWSCGKPCKKKLTCGQHLCPIPCHEEKTCPPCEKKSVQLCLCQRHQKLCDCSEPQWQCQDKCGNKLDCGYHMCEVTCHERNDCPPCPLSQVRHCPCGKSQYQLPCTVATPTCGDTCDKTLACGNHVCVERCHRGSCGSCLQMIVKYCKCGAKKKEVSCAKDYTCDIKCKNLKDCKKHTCNRKCCDGRDCPPCDQICNKTLACKNHKCSSRCHQGSCYPCTLTKEVSCNCSSSRVLVHCGMEKTTKPPKCRQKCHKPSDCHHDKQLPHSCHFGRCPPCKQACLKVMKCGHSCPVTCHDQVLVKIDDTKKASTPWEDTGPKAEIRELECPPCRFPVPVTCLGGHETADWPCSIAKAASCGRKCGRSLPCSNHACLRDCHRVKNAPDEAQCGSNCRKCESECLKQRPEGCSHSCLKPCHPGPCDPCGQMIRIRCNCGITQLYVKCGEWTSADEAAKRQMSCCNDQCPKQMECGHRCNLICHIGECSSKSTCKKKTKLYCPCKRLKVEFQCNRAQSQTVQCDQECQSLKLKARSEEEKLENQKKMKLEQLQREEAERFEAKMEGKRGRNRRNRRNMSETEEVGMLQKIKIPLFVGAFIGIVVAFVALYY